MAQEPYQNSNMDQRPGNASLLSTAVMQLVVIGFAGAVVPAAALMFLRGLPFDFLSASVTALGALVALGIFIPKNLQYARRQKAAYMSAGGDPTGISLFMFGAMGGKVRPDGIWEWRSKHDDYSA
jgi:hypothetical protein